MKLTNHGKSVLYKIYAFLAYSSIMFVLFVLKLNEYTTDSRLGFYAIIVLAFVIVAFKDTIKNIFNYNLLLSVSVILLICALLGYTIGREMILISTCSVIASIISMFFGVVADTYAEYAFFTDKNGIKRKNLEVAISDKQAWRESYGFCFAKEEKPEEIPDTTESV